MKKLSLFRFGFGLFLAGAVVMSVLPGTVRAASSAEILNRLNSLKSQNTTLKNEIAKVRSQYDANAEQITQLVAKKNAIDQEISLLHTQMLNIEEQITIMGQLVAEKQDELDIAQKNLDELNQKYKYRVRAMEESGGVSYWEVIFRSRSFTDLLDRINIVDEIAASDQKRLDEMNEAALEVELSRSVIAAERLELDVVRQELEDAQEQLSVSREASDETLRVLAQKQAEFQALLDESEAKQTALMNEIAKAQKDYDNAKYQENLKNMALTGKNPPSNATWLTPVSGYYISSAFGYRTAPTAGASTYHQGVDMACSQGTPIYATRAGTVTRASFQAGGAGYYVSIDHADGFASIYMHMTHFVVSAGQKVSAGQLIGYVGSTGVSTGPHLHFGISYAGTYVNPLAYIG